MIRVNIFLLTGKYIFIRIIYSLLSSFLLDFIYLFLEQGEGKDKDKETNINVRLPLAHPKLRDLFYNPGICPEKESNQ